jgi:pimeloyl-ACP methyl ester carboxylesterase
VRRSRHGPARGSKRSRLNARHRGDFDGATPPADGRFLAERIPGARLIELDAAHLSNIEAAPAFNAALASFL